MLTFTPQAFSILI